MQNVNTQGRLPGRLNSMYVRVFKAPLPFALKTGLVATVFCCLFSQNLVAQCCPISQPQGAFINLSLDNTGNVQINPNVFVPYVGSSNSPCLPVNGGIIQLWSDATATTPFPNTNYNCTHIGTQVNVYVTLDIPGACANPPVAPFVVEIVDFVAPIVSGLSPSQTVNAAPGTCAATVTGLTPTITDNCNNTYRLGWIKTGATTGSCAGMPGTYPGPCTTANGSFNVGITTVTFHVIYQVSITPLNEDTITLVRTVTVNDTQAPTYNLPGYSQSSSPLNADAMCVGTPNWSYPTASDNCGVTKYRVKLTYPNASTSLHDINPATGVATPPLPATLPLGTTQVRDTLSDGTPSGTIVHAYNVVVQDVTAPTWTGLPATLDVGATANCEAVVTALDYSNPTFYSDNCGVVSRTVTAELIAGGPVPFTTISGSNGNATYPDGQYRIIYAATDAAGLVGRDTIILTVADNVPPTVTCPVTPITVYIDGTSSQDSAVVNAANLGIISSDNCGVDNHQISKTSPLTSMTGSVIYYGCMDDGLQTAYYRVRDASGNVSATCTIVLNVVDNVLPVAQCQPVSVNLDAMGNASATAIQINDGSYDNCGVYSIGVDPIIVCATVTEGSNFDKTMSFSPPLPPGAVFSGLLFASYGTPTGSCPNFTTGACHSSNSANVVTNFLLSGSSSMLVDNAAFGGDPCGGTPKFLYVVARYTVPSISFDCDDVGPNTVSLYVTDVNGNVNTCSTTVTVNDPIPPTTPAVCNPLTVYLDADGEASVNDFATRTFSASPGTALPGSVTTISNTIVIGGDAANIVDLNLSLVINHTRIGDLSATLTPPVGPAITLFDRPGYAGFGLGCLGDNINVKFDDEAFFTAADFENTCNNLPAIGGTFKSVGLLSQVDGINLVGNWTLTITDHAGFVFPFGSGVGTFVSWSLQIVEDETTNIELLGLGNTDNCPDNLSWSASPSSFDCTDLGPNTYTLTVTDGTNAVTCQNTITVVDEIPPTAICKPATLPLDALGNATLLPSMVNDNSTDNCVSNLTYSVSPNTFDCSDIGGFPTVTLSVSDGTHTSTCEATVTVIDNIPPVPACTAISVPLGSNGEVTVLAQQLALASYDACGIVSYEISVDTDNNGIPDSPFGVFATLDCYYVDDDPVQVSIRVTDGSGNFSICNTTIDVQDNELPILTIPADVTIECDDPQTPDAMNAVGIATATDNTDDCHPVVPTKVDVIPADSYLCDDAYTIVRTWTATDFYGNTVSADQIITVRDFTAPTFTRPSDALAVECPASTLIANKVGPITMASTNVPVAISASGTPTVSSTLNFTGVGKVLDLNVKNLGITHAFSGDLRVVLTSPSGTSVRLFDRLCGSADNVDISFDDQSVNPYSSIPCGPLGNAGTYRSLAPLSIFNGEASNGTWTLTVFDFANLDGGSLNSWSLEITYAEGPNTITQTGDVTNEADNCMPESRQAYFVDYQAYKGFVNHTAPSMYNLTGTPFSSNGSSASANSTTVTLVSDNNGLPIGDATYALNNPIPANGYVIFDWSYTTTDLPERDSFGYVLNGVFTQLSDDMGGPSQLNNRVVLPVSMGNTFGFAMRSRTGATGAATAVITNFIFTNLATPTLLDMCEHKFSLARFWTMVDDCGNQAPYQVQCITTNDTQKPNIYFPASNVTSAPTATMTVLATGMVCTPYVDLDLTDVYVSDGCSDYDDLTIWNNALSLYGTGNGDEDASGYYFPGSYPIRFIVEDECQHRDTLDLTLVVTDNQTPTAVCFPAIIVQLDNTGNASITPVNINNGSSDNCGIVTYSLSQSAFTTADIGVVPVTLTVFDAQGNSNTCTSQVTVLGGVILDVQDASGPVGGMASPVVTANKFQQVTSFSMDLEIVNPLVAVTTFPTQTGGITGINPALTSGGTFTFVINSASKASISWFSNSPSGLTLADGTALFSLKTNLVGTLGSSTPVIINNDEIFTVPGGIVNPVPSIGLSGTITILNTSIQYTISGSLKREANCVSPTGDPVNNVTVTLTGTASTPPSPDTNADGSYSFSVAAGSTFTVKPTKDGTTTGLPNPGTWFTGIDIIDVIAVNEHFLGLNLLNSDYKKVAADANKSGTINIADVFIINQLSLSIFPSGLNNTAWRFVDASFGFPPSAPLVVPAFPEDVTVNAISANTVRNFIGVKVGDVNCSANVNLFTNGNGVDERGGLLPFLANDQYFTAGQQITVPFLAKDFAEMKGYQLTVRFDSDALKFQSFQPGSLAGLTEGNLNATAADEGFIATNWFNFEPTDLADGETVFSLTFTALQDGRLSDLLNFNSDFIQAMAVKANGDVFGVNLEFNTATLANEEHSSHFALYQNRPNPFAHVTQIGFRLPQPDRAKLSIFDASGRVLKVVEANFSAGYHQVNVERNELPGSGILFYQLETSTDRAIRKMVLID